MTENGARTIVGGGDSAAAVNQLGLASKYTLVSTGGERRLDTIAGVACPRSLHTPVT
jgi:phosphoglycerate kinase